MLKLRQGIQLVRRWLEDREDEAKNRPLGCSHHTIKIRKCEHRVIPVCGEELKQLCEDDDVESHDGAEMCNCRDSDFVRPSRPV